VDSDGAIPVESVWRKLEEGKSYRIMDENLTSGAVANAFVLPTDNMTSYTFSSPGQHRLTITEYQTPISLGDIQGANGSPDRIIANLDLPSVGSNGETLAWVSDNPGAISNESGNFDPVRGMLSFSAGKFTEGKLTELIDDMNKR